MVTVMDRASRKRQIRGWIWDMSPALVVVSATILFSTLFGDGALRGWREAARSLIRFLRFSLILCLPLYALPSIFRMITNRLGSVLLVVDKVRGREVSSSTHWLFRPFQGIGIGFLFGSKLLIVLQLIAGPNIKSSLLIPQGHFELGRFLLITAITVFVSLVLSTLWTLDDVGIRYYNRRDQELKMLGKYVGTLMPVIFGLYGLFGLFSDYPTGDALIYACKIVAILYPPMVVFAVLHTYFVGRKSAVFSKTLPTKGGVWTEQKPKTPR
jgi:hypothetical protein